MHETEKDGLNLAAELQKRKRLAIRGLLARPGSLLGLVVEELQAGLNERDPKGGTEILQPLLEVQYQKHSNAIREKHICSANRVL
eukprot:scaffold15097_cov37-Prasinocladus_malaysianus.AAC.1